MMDLIIDHNIYLKIKNKDLLDDESMYNLLNLLKYYLNISNEEKEEIYIIDPQVTLNYLKKKKNICFFINFFKYDIVIIPLHNSFHWSIAIYLKKRNLLIYNDSIKDYHKEYFIEYINFLKNNKIIENFDTYHLNIYQNNTWECGYYVLIIFFYILSNLDKEFQIQDIQFNLFINTLEKIIYKLNEATTL